MLYPKILSYKLHKLSCFYLFYRKLNELSICLLHTKIFAEKGAAMQIKVISPVVGSLSSLEDEQITLNNASRPGTTLDLHYLDFGFPSVESELSHTVNAAQVIVETLRSDCSHYDGIFINCFDDPGVLPLREALSIPVCGGYVPSMLTAMSLGDRIAVITTDERCIPNENRKARTYGFDHHLAAVGCVSIAVVDLLTQQEELLDRVAAECERLYRDYQVNVVCLGCTVMAGIWKPLQKRLALHGCPVYVVEPMTTGIHWLENLIDMGYTNSLGLNLTLDTLKWK